MSVKLYKETVWVKEEGGVKRVGVQLTKVLKGKYGGAKECWP